MTQEIMTRHEREDLQRLVRQREKVQKSAAKQRSAELLADFDSQLAAQYRFDDDAVWAQATAMAKVEVDKMQAVIAARCAELGIPAEFAPGIELRWHNAGYRNVLKEQKDELRKVAQSRIAAIEASACVAIETASVDAQTKLALAGLTSEAARGFLEALPSVNDLMAKISFAEIAGKASPSVASQLIAPPALRKEAMPETASLSQAGAL